MGGFASPIEALDDAIVVVFDGGLAFSCLAAEEAVGAIRWDDNLTGRVGDLGVGLLRTGRLLLAAVVLVPAAVVVPAEEPVAVPIAPSEVAALALAAEDAVCAVRELRRGLEDVLEGVEGADDLESEVVGRRGLFGLAILVAGESLSLAWWRVRDGFDAIDRAFVGVSSFAFFAGVPAGDPEMADARGNEAWDTFLGMLLLCGEAIALALAAVGSAAFRCSALFSLVSVPRLVATSAFASLAVSVPISGAPCSSTLVAFGEVIGCGSSVAVACVLSAGSGASILFLAF